jgi:DNA-damage-inducible protein D
MNLLIIPYDPFGNDSLMDLFEDATASDRQFYGSDLARILGYENNTAFDEAIHIALDACAALHIKVRQHFQPLYRQSDGGLYADWKLSRLACTLIILHADPTRPAVMKAQLLFLKKML